MKKMRLIIRLATGALVLITVISIMLIVFNDRDITDTTYEIISFVMTLTAVSIAIFSQIDAYREQKRFEKINKELLELMGESDMQNNSENRIKKKLNEILRIDEAILKKITPPKK
jgi:intracellular septation protein A